jgi:hypothetical protein
MAVATLAGALVADVARLWRRLTGGAARPHGGASAG